MLAATVYMLTRLRFWRGRLDANLARLTTAGMR
jgi:hypothetical protein